MNPRHQNNYPPRSVTQLFRVHNMLYYTYIYIYIELNIPRLKKHERKAFVNYAMLLY